MSDHYTGSRLSDVYQLREEGTVVHNRSIDRVAFAYDPETGRSEEK